MNQQTLQVDGAVPLALRVYEPAGAARASVVIGNPPFIGVSKKRGELGADYFDALNAVYGATVPAAARFSP